MKKLARVVAILGIVCLAEVVLAQEVGTNGPLRVAVCLADGSRVIGTPDIVAVAVHTPYAQPEISFAQVRRMEMHDDHETVSVEMQNGDKLTGTVDLRQLGLDTPWGRLVCGVQYIKRIECATIAPQPSMRLATLHVDNFRNCADCNRGVTIPDLPPGVYTVEVAGEGIRNGICAEAQLLHQAIVTAWDGKGWSCFRALDGKNDRTTIELKDRGYITAFTVDSNSADNSGSVDVMIYGCRRFTSDTEKKQSIPPPDASSIGVPDLRVINLRAPAKTGGDGKL